ncbi:MAG: hypothetical protein QNK33_00210 [Bacteroidales bacterium]|nr:hypothetical protein [Bacteroidales bacterium]
MKKKLLYVGAFLLVASTFSSCEDILDCQDCRYNVYVNDVFTYSELEKEYCDTDLIARKAAPDVTIEAPPGTFTVTKFECDN